VFNLGWGGQAWLGEIGRCGVPGSGPCISFTLVPAIPYSEPLQTSQSHAGTTVDVHLATGQPGIVLRCRIDASSRDLFRLRREIHRLVNHRRSTWAIAGMVVVLALCGWVADGADGARRAVAGGIPSSDGLAISRETMYRWFGARLLHPSYMPGLFNILADVCRRARLARMPDLYCLEAPSNMNAYALGGPEGSAIVLTHELLRSMTPCEIAGILAHEVGHIRNNDAWAMNWASALHQAIEWNAWVGLARLRARNDSAAAGGLGMLLSAAPTISRLLCLALSRIRELDADATALELTDDSQGLVAALEKLERHHNGSPILLAAAVEHDPMQFLRSHPATSERVGTLLSLAH